MTAELSTLVMTRRFEASPEAVFDAWTDPEIAKRWLFAGPLSQAHETRMDLRVGGKWSVMDRRGGVDYTALGEYVEIDRPHRLVFTFGMPQFSPEFCTVTVAIQADGDGAVMTMSQDRLPPDEVKPSEGGWALMFAGLGHILADG